MGEKGEKGKKGGGKGGRNGEKENCGSVGIILMLKKRKGIGKKKRAELLNAFIFSDISGSRGDKSSAGSACKLKRREKSGENGLKTA